MKKKKGNSLEMIMENAQKKEKKKGNSLDMMMTWIWKMPSSIPCFEEYNSSHA